ncbi:hypothetical protein ACOMHN_035206 [Nucella lapillus]
MDGVVKLRRWEQQAALSIRSGEKGRLHAGWRSESISSHKTQQLAPVPPKKKWERQGEKTRQKNRKVNDAPRIIITRSTMLQE